MKHNRTCYLVINMTTQYLLSYVLYHVRRNLRETTIGKHIQHGKYIPLDETKLVEDNNHQLARYVLDRVYLGVVSWNKG